jgi:putative oxygen-independent coproporphyrinogen III oxidase
VTTEIERAGLRRVTSVFVGGGTPSHVDGRRLGAVIASIDLDPAAEVTVECNPDDVTADLLAAYRAAGVTRISLGVQSMDRDVLVSLGRWHQPSSVAGAAALVIDAGFTTWNLDLIYGGAGESLASWRRTLDAAIALGPSHLSVYGLTVEPGTPLAADPSRHPDDDDQADKYLLAADVLADAGMEHYEISNWALPGHRCRHNELTWAMGDYVGVGCAAHSHRSGRRWWNVWSIDRYVERIESGRSAEAGSEQLGEGERALEALQLALRTSAGVPVGAIDLDGVPEACVYVDDGVARLTTQGMLVANELSLRLR